LIFDTCVARRGRQDENLLKKDEIKLDYDDKNEFTHVYTLILKPDGSFQVSEQVETVCLPTLRDQ